MARYNFTAGAILSFNYERIKFLHIANDDADTHVFEKEDGLTLELPSDRVLAEMQAGRLYQIPGLALKRPKIIDSLNANDNERGVARWRARFVRRWLDKGAPKLSARNLRPIIQEVQSEIDEGPHDDPDRLRRPPAWNTLVRWIQEYRRGTGSVSSLFPQGRLAGNRKRKLDTQIGELIEETIWDEYLVRNGPSIHKVWSDLLDRLATINAQRMKRQEPQVPHISYSTMQRAIKEICPFIVDCCRKGPDIAKREWRSRGGGYVTDRANERWQIDHTQCDVHAISEFDNQPIGRPWLTVVVDVHTRMIMSAVISYSAPDEGTVLLALKRAILGMGPHLEHLGITNTYPVHGKVEVLYSDNGPEFRSEGVKEACRKLFIHQEFAPIHRPWFKGVIERLFRTISRSVFHVMPGTTKGSVRELGPDESPLKEAALTIHDIEVQFWRFVIDTYQYRHHKGLLDRPRALWDREMKKPVPPPCNPSDVLEATSYRTGRVVQTRGIEFKGLYYGTPHAPELRMRFKGRERLPIIVDPDNLTYITVVDDYARPEQRLLPLQICKEQEGLVRGRTLEEHRMRRSILRNLTSLGTELPDDELNARAEAYAKDAARKSNASKEMRLMAEATKRSHLRQTRRKEEAVRNAAGDGVPGAFDDVFGDTDIVVDAVANDPMAHCDVPGADPTNEGSEQRIGEAQPSAEVDDLATLREVLGVKTADHRADDDRC